MNVSKPLCIAISIFLSSCAWGLNVYPVYDCGIYEVTGEMKRPNQIVVLKGTRKEHYINLKSAPDLTPTGFTGFPLLYRFKIQIEKYSDKRETAASLIGMPTDGQPNDKIKLIEKKKCGP